MGLRDLPLFARAQVSSWRQTGKKCAAGSADQKMVRCQDFFICGIHWDVGQWTTVDEVLHLSHDCAECLLLWCLFWQGSSQAFFHRSHKALPAAAKVWGGRQIKNPLNASWREECGNPLLVELLSDLLQLVVCTNKVSAVVGKNPSWTATSRYKSTDCHDGRVRGEATGDL